MELITINNVQKDIKDLNHLNASNTNYIEFTMFNYLVKNRKKILSQRQCPFHFTPCTCVLRVIEIQ